jgi:nicotinate-nucleotide pyrophosphorylase (carboxylating)
MPEYPSYLNDSLINDFITRALKEDIGPGDYTTLAAIEHDAKGSAELIMKEDGIVAGVAIATKVFTVVDPFLLVEILIADGTEVKKGDLVLRVEGRVQSILSAERLVLNIMQRMSGIATKTYALNNLIAGTGAKLLDTRKTTPNFRAFEKWAVFIGGGVNHRFALYDMVMLKDNHNDYAGGIPKSVAKTKKYLLDNGLDLKIEVETRNLNEVKEALNAGADIILLDNMPPAKMREAVDLIKGQCVTEASGGITEENIREIAETGVDYISVGALTHSYTSLDMSLKAILK